MVNDLYGPFSFAIVNVKKRPTTAQLTHLSRAHAPLTVVLLFLYCIIIIISYRDKSKFIILMLTSLKTSIITI